MPNYLARNQEWIYAVLRIVTGFLFSLHGASKILGAFGGTPDFGNLEKTTAGIIELAGGVLIALGLFTVPLAFLSSGLMAVAYFKAHAPKGFWPLVNKGELAALYSFLFLYIAAHGPGPLSLDRLISRRKP